MLYKQIKSGSFEAEVGLDVKIFRAGIKKLVQEDDIYRMTAIVARYIERNKKLTGNLKEPKSYVHGVLDLEGIFLEERTRKSVILTGGGYPEHGIILGGSLSNVVSQEKMADLEEMNHSSSDLLGITQVLELVKRYEKGNNKRYSKKSTKEEGLLPKVKSAQQLPYRKYEFLAKVLNENEIGEIPSSIIASPIYVAIP